MLSALFAPYAGHILIGSMVVVCGLTAWVVLLQVRVSHMRKQYTRLMAGTDGANLEEALNQHIDQIREALDTTSALQAKTRRMEWTLNHCFQWMGIVRFSPFRNTGGAQSFALVIADERGDGVVLSSLHSRENTRVYAKALSGWESYYALTDEEKQAIARARQQRV